MTRKGNAALVSLLAAAVYYFLWVAKTLSAITSLDFGASQASFIPYCPKIRVSIGSSSEFGLRIRRFPQGTKTFARDFV